ncbi:ankyrin repeat domain-containing protein [Acidobacteriota bacterium]
MRIRKKFVGFWLIFCLASFSLLAEEIHEAAREGDLAKIKTLLKENPEWVNARDDEGNTPMHAASGSGHLEVVKFLVAHGADVNSLNSANQGPLLFASYEGFQALVEFLLSKEADYKTKDRYGRSPLHYAARQGKPTVVNILVRSGVDPNLKDEVGFTPLEYAIRAGRTQVLEIFLELGIIKPKEDSGRRTLHAVAAKGYERFVNRLIAKGADIRTRDDSGGSLLHNAVKGCLSAIVNMLLANGLDINARDSRGRTPLPYAVELDDIDIVKTLVGSGAAINVKGNDMRTPLHVAEDWGFKEVAAYLESKGAQPSPRQSIVLKRESSYSKDNKRKTEKPYVEISYIANDGFMIATESKKILVDALFQNPFGYSDTPVKAFEKVLKKQPPFEKIDLILFSHAHRDHFEPEMAQQALAVHQEAMLVGNAVLNKEFQQQAGDNFQSLSSRVHNINPEWGSIFTKVINGIDVKIFPVNHADLNGEYVTLAYVIELVGIRILHLGDIYAPSNVDYFKKYALEKERIDIAFIDPFFLLDHAGQEILKNNIQPQIIIPMHMRAEEIDRYAKELGKLYSNLAVFWEPMEKKIFTKE